MKTSWYERHKEEKKAASKLWRDTHKGEQRAYAKSYHEFLRRSVFDHYGWACSCCEETEPTFLTIDHMNNDGATHRKENGLGSGGSSLYKWLIDNNYPEGFQTLCYNCNCSKGRYGQCVHEKEKQSANSSA